jgi:hypothetical protein
MGKNFLRIREDVSLSLVSPQLVKINDDFSKDSLPSIGHPLDAHQQTMRGLQVRIAASHAGIITRNNGFYLPNEMKVGAGTFTEHYPKPLLLHHEDHNDPVGRIVGANYVDTSGAIADKYDGLVVKDSKGKALGTITSQMIKDFQTDRMPFGQKVDVVRALFRDSLLEDKSYEGMGHVQILGLVTDPTAIQKLLDGRYLTGSVGATTDRAVCSICKKDWTEEGPCEHRPGSVYEGMKSFIIAGKLFYEEYSFVNTPADRHSRVLELNYNGIQNSVEIANDSTGRIWEVALEFPQYDSTNKEATMAEVKDSTGTEPVITTEIKPTETPVPVPEATTPVVDAAPAVTPEEPVAEVDEVFFNRVVELEDLNEVDEQRLYDMIWAEVETAVKDGELTDDLIKDAKLSTEKRKALASSTFCGPGRSFPVPDCAHVTAARRLINRYKGEGKKSAILACVSRKAKAMGCDKATDAVTPEAPQETAPVVDQAPVVEATVKKDNCCSNVLRGLINVLETDAGDSMYASIGESEVEDEEGVLGEEEKNMLRMIMKRLSGIVGMDAWNQAAALENLVIIDVTDVQAVTAEVVKLEETLGGVRDELKKTTQEYAKLAQDLQVMQDALVNEKVITRKAKESHLTLLNQLVSTNPEDADVLKITDEVLESNLAKLSKDIDITKIVDKLNDGMSRTPGTIIDSPMPVLENSKVQERVSASKLARIEEEYFRILLTSGQKAAESFKDEMRRAGYLPTEN